MENMWQVVIRRADQPGRKDSYEHVLADTCETGTIGELIFYQHVTKRGFLFTETGEAVVASYAPGAWISVKLVAVP